MVYKLININFLYQALMAEWLWYLLEIKCDIPAQLQILHAALTFCLSWYLTFWFRGLKCKNHQLLLSSCDSRLVKAFDFKSNWIFPRSFKSCLQRTFFVSLCMWQSGIVVYKLITINFLYKAVMAEWLRRLTRNQMGYSRAGSNPARSVHFLFLSVFADPVLWFII